MRLKPKTIRRLALLGGVAALVVALAFTLLVVRRWQSERLMSGLRAEGLAALEAGDAYLALNKLAPYMREHFDDPEATKAYALARSRVEEFDGSHLMQAIGHYRRYLELNPEDRDAAVTLLGWYNQVAHHPEARDLAASLRPEDPAHAGPEHAEILLQEAHALLALREEGDRLRAVAKRLTEVAPDNLQGQLLRMRTISRTDGIPAAKAYADELVAQRPDSPHARLAAALGLLMNPTVEDLPHVRSLLSDIAGLRATDGHRLRPTPAHDPGFVRLLVESFDRLNQFEHARAVLLDAAEPSGDTALRQLLVRRLWQEARHEDVERLTAGLNPANRDADAERLGFRALSLLQLGRADEALAIAAALSEREGDFRAAGWALALPTRNPAAPAPPREALDALRQAIERHPLEPAFSYFRGEALAALERAPEALKAWSSAARSPLAAGWVLPHARSAELLLADSRIEEGVEAATEALIAAPSNVPVNVLWFEAHAARIERGLTTGPDPVAILRRIEHTRERLDLETHEAFRPFRHRLAAAHAAMLAATGQPAAARRVIEQQLALQEPIEAPTLLRLADTSLSHRLDLAEACLDRAQSLHGLSPSLALARANLLASRGRADEARNLLRQAAADQPDLAREYDIAAARFLQSLNHPDAAATWAALGDKYPDDVRIQRLCLDAPAAAADPAFIERVSQRYRTLAGRELEPDSVPVRIARARVLLRGEPSRVQRAEALALLNSAVVDEPSLLEPRLLLAAALRMDDPGRDLTPDLPGAIAQLTTAVRLAPNAAAITIDLARTLQATREFDTAREHLLRVASSATFNPDERLAACQLLIAQADTAAAVGPLSDLLGAAGDDASPALLTTFASAHRARRQDDKAAAVYERLVASPRAAPEPLLEAALFFATHDAPDRAQAALERAAQLAPAPGEALLLRARFEAGAGEPEKAAELFQAATAEAPTNPSAWTRHAEFLLSRGDAPAALAIAERAREALPSDPRIVVLHERTRLAANADGDAEFGPLLRAMSADASYAQLRPILNAIDQLREQGRLDDPRAIADLADRLQSFLPVQIFAAKRLAELDPPDLDRAAAIASRAVLAFPSRHEPAQLAADLYARLGRWNDMLRAANLWRERDPSRPAAADLAAAHAAFAMGNAPACLRAITPRIADALAEPREPLSVAVLNIYARALIASGRAAQAHDLLAPLLPTAPEVRTQVWLAIAGRDLRSAEEADAWIDEASTHADPESADEHLALAAALSTLATRFPDHKDRFLAHALDVLGRLTAGLGAASPAALEALGITRHRTGDIAGAEECYRRAIDLDPERAVALNNLATILMDRGDLQNALELATRSVRAGGAGIAASLDTLALVHVKLADSLREGPSPGAAATHDAQAAAAYERLAAHRPGALPTLRSWAQCAARAGDLHSEARAYERMLAAKDLEPAMEPMIRNNLAYTLYQIGGRAELDRAREHVTAALVASDAPQLHDTLGWIELRAGRRDAAAAAFRRALERRPDMPSASVGLAAVLAEGTPEDRGEAAGILARVESGDDPLPPTLAAQAGEIRKKLGGS